MDIMCLRCVHSGGEPTEKQIGAIISLSLSQDMNQTTNQTNVLTSITPVYISRVVFADASKMNVVYEMVTTHTAFVNFYPFSCIYLEMLKACVAFLRFDFV